jgi:4-hydroxy-4-methyl-2-oxoglutarate aldolase
VEAQGKSFSPSLNSTLHIAASLDALIQAQSSKLFPVASDASILSRTEIFMSTIHAVQPADLDLLRKFDTPTVCNVIELFDLRPRTSGYMNARIQACYPKLPPMVGYASTATFRSASPPRSGNVYSGLSEQVAAFADLPGLAVIVFQDLDDPIASATFGEVMCTTYKSFGAVGLITSGAGRDLDQVEKLDFACFTSGTITAHGYCHIVQHHVPVHVGGVAIHPGDLLHGDRNGVTSIPNEIASLVAHACQEYMDAEAEVLDYLKLPRIDAKGFAAARIRCNERIATLARRLKARK